MSHVTHREHCRLCESKEFELVLPILPSAIGDAFVSAEQLCEKQEVYPLDTYLCLNCGHLQNLDVVDPAILFGSYTYRTSVSLGLVAHFNAYSKNVSEYLNLKEGAFVVEMGSNDGSLLKAFKAQGMRVLGVDPAKQIASEATQAGVPTIPDFFSLKVSKKIKEEQGPADLICANNVFAHMDDMNDCVQGIGDLLKPDGVFVFEVSYLPDMVERFVFDTIYHEHVSHHALIPLEKFFNRLGLALFHVEKVESKGGSIRGFVQKLATGVRTRSSALNALFVHESNIQITQPEIHRNFFKNIQKKKGSVIHHVDEALSQGKVVVGYGASTTTTTLLYHFELGTRLSFIVDDNPVKHHLFSPGFHLPVLPSSELYKRKPDIVLLLAWTYAEPIVQRHEEFVREGGEFWIPLPSFRKISKISSSALEEGTVEYLS